MSTDEVVLYDTQEQSKIASTAPIFKLAPPDWPTLYQVLPEFDFKKPPVNPAEFASSDSTSSVASASASSGGCSFSSS